MPAVKKVCIITTIPFTMRAFVLDTAIHLHNNGGFDVTLICDHDESLATELPEGLRYIPVRMRRGVDPAGVVTVLQLMRVFLRERFDLVQYSTPNASFYASIAARLSRVPVRLYAQWGVLYVGFAGVKRRVFRAIERITCALSTVIQPDSHGNLKFCVAEGLYARGKGEVVWNGSADGVNLGVFDITRKDEWARQVRSSLDIPQAAVVFGYVGRITRDKGVNELLEAFQSISQQIPSAYLLMVGDPENVDSLNRVLFEWARDEPRVLFTDYVDDSERYFAAMDVFVLPSYREGFGSVVIEASAMGIPVIVTDIPGPTDAVIRDVTGMVVGKQDPADLEQAMARLASDSELRKGMGEAGYRHVAANFDHDLMLQHLLENRRRLLELA